MLFVTKESQFSAIKINWNNFHFTYMSLAVAWFVPLEADFSLQKPVFIPTQFTWDLW